MASGKYWRRHLLKTNVDNGFKTTQKTLIAIITLAASTFFAGVANAQSSESPGINALRFFFKRG